MGSSPIDRTIEDQKTMHVSACIVFSLRFTFAVGFVMMQITMGGDNMMQSEKIKRALDAVEDACGHCAVCSPDCPIAISKRALAGLLADVKQMEASPMESECS